MRVICVLAVFVSCELRAQVNNQSADIAVIARSYRDSISLRWAPTNFSIWKLGNEFGYAVERYTLVRNRLVLKTPERKILTNPVLKPQEEARWESIVKQNKYAAIAAQALFGDRFEIDIQQSDVFRVINKVTENEQRFGFALFSADMSVDVARASGLLFTDTQTNYDEQYLYRVVIYNGTDTLRGSVFIEPEYIIPLPKPEKLMVSFQEKTAMLQWRKVALNNVYTAYRIERSIEGKQFFAPSDIPATTFSPSVDHDSAFEYYTDSISDLTQNYYYRVFGISPFGELSPPSEVVSGHSVSQIDDVPVIANGKNVDNQSVQIQWEFPEESNKSIQGFTVERGLSVKGPFQEISQVEKTVRIYFDRTPNPVNYYRVNALQIDGPAIASSVYLVQLVDSIPPTAPSNLKAFVNELGLATLTWDANSEEDIYGYRIYKANVSTEEFFQITTEPIMESNYVDTVNLNTLNEHVYYVVMAIDRSQNHSRLSNRLEVSIPDRIKPQPPVFLPTKSDENGVHLSWEKSASSDVVRYDVYRQRDNEKEWLRIKVCYSQVEGIYQYTDTATTENGKSNLYTVVAIDESELESDPANIIRAAKIASPARSAVKWKEPLIDRANSRIILSWEYGLSGVEFFRIYKASPNSKSMLYKVLPSGQKHFDDRALGAGQTYTYRIMACFRNGSKSFLSDVIVVNY